MPDQSAPLDNKANTSDEHVTSSDARLIDAASYRLPPLEQGETRLFVANYLFSQLLILVIGVILAIVADGLASGDWIGVLVNFTWVHSISASLMALQPGMTFLFALGIAILFVLINASVERLAMKTETGREAVYEGRQGINGELPRLPVLLLVVLMMLTGFAEELLFRYGIVAIALVIFSNALPAFLAVIIALFVSTLAFSFAHVRYRDVYSMGVTMTFGLLLGIVFLLTGSLAAIAGGHAIYDFAVTIIERVRMKRDPSYFGGEAPTRLLLDQVEQSKQEAK